MRMTHLCALVAALHLAAAGPLSRDAHEDARRSGPAPAPRTTQLKQVTRQTLIERKRNSRAGWRRDAAPSATPPPDTVTFPYHVYTQYYAGSGYTETDDNDGNTYEPPVQEFIDGTMQPSDAVTACAQFAYGSGNIYLSFQLWYDTSADHWVCRAYYDPNDDTSAFNVANSDANPVYGYSY